MRTIGSLWVLAVVVAMSVACGREVPETAAPLRAVLAVDVLEVDLEERLEASGELLAKNRAEVAAQVEGEITEVLFDEGQAVPAGAVVLEIDPERRELELARASAQVGEASAAVAERKREVDRMLQLAQRKVASETQLDQAQTELETARARLRAARADLGVAKRALRDASVRARFAGLIAVRYASRGEFVRQGQALFELVSLDPLEVEFRLPEAESARVRRGMPIEVQVAPYPDEVFEAKVTVVSPTIDKRTRTLRVKALLENDEGRLRPGLFARANLGVALRKGILMVPEEAVLQRADGAVVYRLDDENRATRLQVETGVIRDGRVEIRTELVPDDRVIARGHTDLVDGVLVALRNPDGSPVESQPEAAVAGAPAPRDESVQ